MNPNNQVVRGNAAIGFPILLAILLLEGFTTISVEVLVIRQLIAVVGNTVVVTSVIIGIFLLFLAFGYYRGGCHANRYRQTLVRNFMLASLFIGVGLSYAFIQAFFYWGLNTLKLNTLLCLSLYLLVAIAPIVYLLGQTLPITTNLFKLNQSVSRISGKALFISTIGSFLGAVLTSLVLMNFLGVAMTIVVNFLLLAVLVVLLLPGLDRFVVSVALGGVLLLIVPVYWLNVMYESSHFLSANAYANYSTGYVYDPAIKKKVKIFMVNNSDSSEISKDLSVSPYAELIQRILFKNLHFRHKRILILGAGGFTLTAKGTHDNEVIYDDVDKSLYRLVNDNYLKKIHGKFIVGDARNIVKFYKKPFNVIISDAFRATNIPFHLITREHFINIERALVPNGLAIFNVIARPTLDDAYSKRINNTILSVFSSCMSIPEEYSHKLTNIVYVCNKSKYTSDKTVYTDDKNRSTVDFYTSRQKLLP